MDPIFGQLHSSPSSCRGHAAGFCATPSNRGAWWRPPASCRRPCLRVRLHLDTAAQENGATCDGTLLLTSRRAQLFDLRLREVAAGDLPPETAAALHAAHAAALAALAAGQPLGSLWPDGADAEPPTVVVGQFAVEIDDERAAAIRPEDWALRQAVVASQGQNGKPKDASGPPVPADSLGERPGGG